MLMFIYVILKKISQNLLFFKEFVSVNHVRKYVQLLCYFRIYIVLVHEEIVVVVKKKRRPEKNFHTESFSLSIYLTFLFFGEVRKNHPKNFYLEKHPLFHPLAKLPMCTLRSQGLVIPSPSSPKMQSSLFGCMLVVFTQMVFYSFRKSFNLGQTNSGLNVIQ